MSFSVVGLPHYTIWHLYEPSYEDIRHMEELEQERAKQEEAENRERSCAQIQWCWGEEGCAKGQWKVQWRKSGTGSQTKRKERQVEEQEACARARI